MCPGRGRKRRRVTGGARASQRRPAPGDEELVLDSEGVATVHSMAELQAGLEALLDG